MSAPPATSEAALSHPARAARFVADLERAHWHDSSLWMVRQKRDRAASEVPGFEALCELSAAIKAHTLGRLADYLEQFEATPPPWAQRSTGPATPSSTTPSSTPAPGRAGCGGS